MNLRLEPVGALGAVTEAPIRRRDSDRVTGLVPRVGISTALESSPVSPFTLVRRRATADGVV